MTGTYRFSSSKWARIFSSSPLLSVAMLHGTCCPKAGSRSVMGLEWRNRYWSSSLHGCGQRKGGEQVLDRETSQGASSQILAQTPGNVCWPRSLWSHIKKARHQVQALACWKRQCLRADWGIFPGCWGFWGLLKYNEKNHLPFYTISLSVCLSFLTFQKDLVSVRTRLLHVNSP